MSAIDSTDKIRSDIEGLLADREELLALRRILDTHRISVSFTSEPSAKRKEYDVEVINRLAYKANVGEDSEAALLELRGVLDGFRKEVTTSFSGGTMRKETDMEVLGKLRHYLMAKRKGIADDRGNVIGPILGINRDGYFEVRLEDVRSKARDEGYATGAETLLALRKVLDKHRQLVSDSDAGLFTFRKQTDEEVIAWLAGAGLSSPPVGTTVTDQHCRILGYLQHWSASTVVVATSGTAGVAPTQPTLQEVYDRITAPMTSEEHAAVDALWRRATKQSAVPEPARHASHMRTLGWEAFAAGRGRDSAPTCLPPDALNAWQGGWDGHYNAVKCRMAAKQSAVPEPPAPKPDKNGLAGMYCPETDEEAIARLATTRTMVSEFVVDETGRPLGSIQGTTFSGKYTVQTDDAHGRAYAKGFWSGMSYTEGRDGAVIGTPSYDRNGAKVGSDARGSGGVQSFHSAPGGPPTTVTCSTGAGGATSTPNPEPLTDQQCADFQRMGSAALWGVSDKPHCPDGPPQAVQAWQRGWDAAARNRDIRRAAKQTAVPEPSAPKPIRLHAGQTWAKGSEEATITYLAPSWPCDERPYCIGSGDILVGVDRIVTDSRGWRLIAGPGFKG